MEDGKLSNEAEATKQLESERETETIKHLYNEPKRAHLTKKLRKRPDGRRGRPEKSAFIGKSESELCGVCESHSERMERARLLIRRCSDVSPPAANHLLSFSLFLLLSKQV